MTFSERMYRAREARHMHETMRGEGHARAMVNNPVYRNQEIAAGMREAPGLKLCDDVADQVQRQIDAYVDSLVRMPPALHLDARTVMRDTSSYAPWGR